MAEFGLVEVSGFVVQPKHIYIRSPTLHSRGIEGLQERRDELGDSPRIPIVAHGRKQDHAQDVRGGTSDRR